MSDDMTTINKHIESLSAQLSTQSSEVERYRRYRLSDDGEVDGAQTMISELRTCGQATVADTLEYLLEHHDDCHQPAANYMLLLAKLAGEPTSHGDCPVAKQIDDQSAEIERLSATLPKTRDGKACVPGDVVYFPERDGPILPLTVDSFAEWTEDDDVADDEFGDDEDDFDQPAGFIAWAMSDRGTGRNVTDCFSTEAAALAAAKEATK